MNTPDFVLELISRYKKKELTANQLGLGAEEFAKFEEIIANTLAGLQQIEAIHNLVNSFFRKR